MQLTIKKFIPKDYSLDQYQENVISKIDHILCINHYSHKAGQSQFITTENNHQDNKLKKIIKKIFYPFIHNNKHNSLPLHASKTQYSKYSGIYLYGGVGRGKTMIMQASHCYTKSNSQIIHYQELMYKIHQEIHKTRKDVKYKTNAHKQDVTTNLIQRLIQNKDNLFLKKQILCIDEFEIKDIAQGVITAQLIFELQKHNIFIFITSNTEPNLLYKDGIQRSMLLEFIRYMMHNFLVLKLDTDLDYRAIKPQYSQKNIIYPIDAQNLKIFDETINRNTNNKEYRQLALKTFGRNILFRNVYRDTLVTSFDELIAQDYGYSDYNNICKHFKKIFLQNMQTIEQNDSNLAMRFINFIDNAYFYQVKIFIISQKPLEELYKGSSLQKEFARTLSRLYEMQSKEYHSK